MGFVRAGYRLPLVIANTVICFSMAMLGRLVTFWKPRAEARWRHYWFRAWGRGMVRIFRVDVDIVGTPPAAPFFLVSNHLSYMDIAVLSSQGGAAFVAKSEIRSWPLIGFVCHHMGTIFINRSSRRDIPRAVGQIESALESGEGVILFPEGTSTLGAEVAPFRASLLAPAASGNLPVTAAALSYGTPSGSRPAHLAVCWWGGMGFTEHFLRLLTLSRFSARLAFADEPIQDLDRKRLASRLEGSVRGMFVPVVGAEA